MAEADAKDVSTMYTHVTYKGVQLMSVVGPPVILLNMVRKRNFAVSKFLRQVTFTSFVGGPAVGLGLGAARMYNMPADGVADRAARLRANLGQRQTDDYSIIGAVLGALVTTTIFMKRSSKLWTLLGGAGLGVAGGVLTHVIQGQAQGKETLNPEMMINEAKEAIEKPKEA